MRRAIALGIALFAADAHAAPVVHASATCAPANKPGRIRCRAVIELPLDAVAAQKLTWGQLAVIASDASVTPLRGRLGPLDAEVREDGRIAWSFSVAAAEVGERKMKLRLSSTVESTSEPTAPVLVSNELEVAVRVQP